MTENKKISVDFTFAFGAIELKQKLDCLNTELKKNFREGRFRTRQRVQGDFICNEIRYEII